MELIDLDIYHPVQPENLGKINVMIIFIYQNSVYISITNVARDLLFAALCSFG